MSIPLSPEYRLSGLAQAGHALLVRVDAALRMNTTRVAREDATRIASPSRPGPIVVPRPAVAVPNLPKASAPALPKITEGDLAKARAIIAAGEVRRAQQRQQAIAQSWRRAIAAINPKRTTR